MASLTKIFAVSGPTIRIRGRAYRPEKYPPQEVIDAIEDPNMRLVWERENEERLLQAVQQYMHVNGLDSKKDMNAIVEYGKGLKSEHASDRKT
jgi:hypothetical protein